MRSPSLLFIALLTPVAFGQAVPSREPSSTHIFPAGGQRGTTVKVRVGGECLPPGMKFKLSGEGLVAPAILGSEANPRGEPSTRRPPRDADGAGAAVAYPREFESEIAIAAGAELGPRFWRVTGARGGTQPRPFLVGDLPEFIETEPNSRPELAERVKLPIVLNGQIAGERDQDFYVFAAKAGELVTCDVLAARIGSPLDPALTITDARGNRIETQEVRIGGDPVLAFKAPADGDYRLHVANLGFPGGPSFVYRITLATRPIAAFAFPPVGRSNETQSVEVYRLAGAGEMAMSREAVRFPAATGPFRSHDVPMVATDWPVVVDSGTNNSAKTALDMPVPGEVCGRFLGATEEDWFRFTAKPGERLTIASRPVPDSLAVPTFAIFDAAGKQLATASAVDTPDRGFEFDWIAPTAGPFTVRLRDLQFGTRGGAQFIYRLTIRPARPDFEMRLEPDFVNVVQGGRTEVDLIVHRSGGFTGPIDLKTAGLTEGLKIEPAVVPLGVPRIKLAFVAGADIRPTDLVASLVGRAEIDKKVVERRATVTSFGRETPNLFVTVQHKPLFKLTCNEAYQYAHRGTVYPYALAVERLNGFDGPITLQLCDRQVQDLDGIAVVGTVIPPGVKETSARVYLPETMNPAAQHHSRPYVQGYATFTDKWGEKQTILAVCDKRCMIRALPPVAKLRAESRDLEARPGETVTCSLVLDRTANFTGPAEVELVGPSGYPAEKMKLAAGESTLVMRVKVPAGRAQAETLTFRASGPLAGGAELRTEAMVRINVR